MKVIHILWIYEMNAYWYLSFLFLNMNTPIAKEILNALSLVPQRRLLKKS